MKPLPPRPLTCLITDGSLTDINYSQSFERTLDAVRSAIDAGVSMIQIREKSLCSRRLLELVRDAVSIAHKSETVVMVNDRTDIALTAGAEGVHLTTTSLPARVVRPFVPAGFLVGVSTHDLAEVSAAVDDGADFAVFGPIFDTPGKAPAKGIEALKEACSNAIPLPVLALGGVDSRNWRAVLAAGAAGFAAIRSLNDPASLRKIMQAVRDE